MFHMCLVVVKEVLQQMGKKIKWKFMRIVLAFINMGSGSESLMSFVKKDLEYMSLSDSDVFTSSFETC